MDLLLHILRFKVWIFLKRSLELRKETVVKHASSVLVFGAFTVGAFLIARMTTAYLLDTARLGLFLLHRFLSMSLFVFFLSINVGNIIVSYAIFYRSQETAHLLTKPVPFGTLTLVKFFENFFYSSTTLFLIAIAVLFGYGSYFHMTWAFYVQSLLLMFIPFMLLGGCIAVITLMVLMRAARRIGVWKVLVGLIFIYLGTLFVFFETTNPVKLVTAVTQNYPNVDEYFGYLDPAFVKYLPNHWIAESLYWTMRGDPTYAMSYTIILVVSTVLVFWLMIYLGKKLFYPSWLDSLELRPSSEVRRSLFSSLSLTRPARLHPHASALLKKEFWLFVREPSQWIHLAIISVLIATFVVSVSNIDIKHTFSYVQTASYMVVLLFNAFLVASIALRFVYPMMSLEGPNFWSVLSAPVSRATAYWMKFIFTFIPILLVSESLGFFSHYPLRQYPLLAEMAMVVLACASFALVGLNLGGGSYFVNYREKNPIRAASSQGATLTFLMSLLYLTFLVSVLFIPLDHYFEHIIRNAPFSSVPLLVSLSIIVVASAAVGVGSLKIGLRALAKDY